MLFICNYLYLGMRRLWNCLEVGDLQGWHEIKPVLVTINSRIGDKLSERTRERVRKNVCMCVCGGGESVCVCVRAIKREKDRKRRGIRKIEREREVRESETDMTFGQDWYKDVSTLHIHDEIYAHTYKHSHAYTHAYAQKKGGWTKEILKSNALKRLKVSVESSTLERLHQTMFWNRRIPLISILCIWTQIRE